MADDGEQEQQADGDNSAAQPGEKWGDPISAERQAELHDLFERQQVWVAQPAATRGHSVFNDVKLSGADVFWLAESLRRQVDGAVPNLHLELADLRGAQMAEANLSLAHLAGANLSLAHLAGADLSLAQLERAAFSGAQLERADLRGAQLKGAFLFRAQLERADLRGARLEEANLSLSHLAGADLSRAQLKGATLSGTQLAGADLSSAQLDGAFLYGAQLAEAILIGVQLTGAVLSKAKLAGADLNLAQLTGAHLEGATFDKTSQLNYAVLTGTSLDQVTFDGVNLTVVDWSLVPVLGDELTARQNKDKDDKRKDRTQRLDEFAAAVRANRVLAVTLRSQGMNEDADRYAYRAQRLQRTLLRLRRQWGAAFGSWLLDVVSGYGYQPVRSVIAYVAIILFFATLYLINGQFASPHLRWDEALVLSISSFHGRGFFTTGISLGDTLARLAAGEAIIGLLIEITFIATFTQRFFAR